MLKNGELHQALFENMLNGFAHCELVYKRGKPVDWRHVLVNSAFEKQSGLKNAKGKLISALIPGIHEATPELLATYSRVATTRIPEKLEQYVEGLRQWFDISVYSVEEDTFTVVFENITERKRSTTEKHLHHNALIKAYTDTIESWSRALDLRDSNTSGHSQRLWEQFNWFVTHINYFPAYFEKLRYGVLLHDVGKIFIPDSILLKQGRLTNAEWEIMRRHPLYAYEILKEVQYLKDVVHIPYLHHERWDGSGYPNGLSKHEIPLDVRLFSIVDAYDAMTSDRPYRKALSKKFALKYIYAQKGILFDPSLVDIFLTHMEEVV